MPDETITLVGGPLHGTSYGWQGGDSALFPHVGEVEAMAGISEPTVPFTELMYRRSRRGRHLFIYRPSRPPIRNGETPKFEVNDIVSRDGSDLQRVTAVDHDYNTITVECVLASEHGWCRPGDVEDNLAGRYRLAE